MTAKRSPGSQTGVTSAALRSGASGSLLRSSPSTFAPNVTATQIANHKRAAWLQREIIVGTPQVSPLRDAWSQWLGVYPWEAWGTLTFRESDFTNDSATRAWGRFVAFLYPAAAQSWFVGHEVGAQGRLHLHCLLGPLTIKRSEAWQWWFTRYGRSEVKGYDPEQGAAKYITKYITKELAHYDVDLRGFEWLSESQHRASNGSKSCIERGRRRV